MTDFQQRVQNTICLIVLQNTSKILNQMPINCEAFVLRLLIYAFSIAQSVKTVDHVEVIHLNSSASQNYHRHKVWANLFECFLALNLTAKCCAGILINSRDFGVLSAIKIIREDAFGRKKRLSPDAHSIPHHRCCAAVKFLLNTPRAFICNANLSHCRFSKSRKGVAAAVAERGKRPKLGAALLLAQRHSAPAKSSAMYATRPRSQLPHLLRSCTAAGNPTTTGGGEGVLLRTPHGPGFAFQVLGASGALIAGSWEIGRPGRSSNGTESKKQIGQPPLLPCFLVATLMMFVVCPWITRIFVLLNAVRCCHNFFITCNYKWISKFLSLWSRMALINPGKHNITTTLKYFILNVLCLI